MASVPSAYARKASRAVRAVGMAVRVGRLVRLPCADCGAAKVQAHHHNGYDREHELDVTWLCAKHHKARHLRPSTKPTWERIGTYAYMDATRPDRNRNYRFYQFGTATTPKRLGQVIGILWSLLVTDEERAYIRSVFDQLGEESQA